MVRPMVRAGAGFHTLAVASTTEQALEATFFPGHLPQVEERYVTAVLHRSKARVEACEVRWRGAHQVLAQTSSVEAGQLGVLGRFRSSWRRSAAIYVGGPDAPRCGPDAHMRKLSACAKRGRRCHLSRPKGIGFRCIPQLVAPIRVGGVHPRDERSRRLDLSRPFFLTNAFIEATRLRNALSGVITSSSRYGTGAGAGVGSGGGEGIVTAAAALLASSPWQPPSLLLSSRGAPSEVLSCVATRSTGKLANLPQIDAREDL